MTEKTMKENSSDSEENETDLGAFKLKDEKSPEDSIQVGSFFKRARGDSAGDNTSLQKKVKNEKLSVTTPVTSSTPKTETSPSIKHSTPPTKRSVSPSTKNDKSAPSSLKSIHSTKPSPSTSKEPRKSQPTSTSKSEAKAQELDNVMAEVVLVLSGFQNPERGQLRDMAVSMGATYRNDWSADCTHLVCAFKNTPKYRQVKGKGIIVTKDWVTECHRQAKLLPCRRFRLDRAASPKAGLIDDDEDEEEEEELSGDDDDFIVDDDDVESEEENDESSNDTFDDDDDVTVLKSNKSKRKKDKFKASGKSSSKDHKYTSKKSSPSPPQPSSSSPPQPSSSSPLQTSSSSSSCLYDDLLSPLTKLPSFFKNLKFFLYGDFSLPEKNFITRYILAYGGLVSDYMADDVSAVISNVEWDENFDEALDDSPGLIFLKPDWLVECINKQSLIPFEKEFQITKT